LREAMKILIQATGGKEYRVNDTNLEPLITAYRQEKHTRLALGRCVVSVAKAGTTFRREIRRNEAINTLPNGKTPQEWDGRWYISTQTDGKAPEIYIAGLNRFLPDSDYPLAGAIENILESPDFNATCST